jgi:hypothetical protein
MEGVGADGRALTFETPGMVRADAQETLRTRQSNGKNNVREGLACILNQGKVSKVVQFLV